MISAKRVVIATIFGFIAGLICLSLGMLAYPDMKYSAIRIGWVLINRTLIGFVIGISAWRINWALHGILLGAIIGLPFSYGMILREINLLDFVIVLLLSIFFGFFIELFTSVIFKAKAKGA